MVKIWWCEDDDGDSNAAVTAPDNQKSVFHKQTLNADFLLLSKQNRSCVTISMLLIQQLFLHALPV